CCCCHAAAAPLASAGEVPARQRALRAGVAGRRQCTLCVGDAPSTRLRRFTHFCLGSVDTRSSEVDTRPSFQQISLPDWDSSVDTVPGSVDTRSGQVDTRPSFQQTSLPNWESRSTLDQGRSTHSG
ncbi:hypothetical protein Taro_047001, partial [Colocasia esculenta]|nr:hypothetical protein [Colocasia esculenta]